eukprot:3767442-Amphidinium_carterae.2
MRQDLHTTLYRFSSAAAVMVHKPRHILTQCKDGCQRGQIPAATGGVIVEGCGMTTGNDTWLCHTEATAIRVLGGFTGVELCVVPVKWSACAAHVCSRPVRVMIASMCPTAKSTCSAADDSFESIMEVLSEATGCVPFVSCMCAAGRSGDCHWYSQAVSCDASKPRRM